MERDRLVARPALDLRRGNLGHELREAPDLLAVEGGQHQPALREVRVLVEQDHRVAADDRLEDARALPRVQDLGGRREDLLDVVRVGEDHERRRREQVHREALAEPRAVAFERGHGPRPPAQRLDPPRRARTRRKRCGGGHVRTLAPAVGWHSCY
jgi:hypothetical protein